MRIAFVTTSLAGGGAEKALLNLADGLTRRGHSCTVVLLEHRVQHEIPSGVTVLGLTAEGSETSKGWLGKRWSAWSLRRAFRRLEAESRFDLIVSTLPHCDEVVSLAGLEAAWFRIANTLSAEIELLARRSPRRAARRRVRYRRLYEGRRLVAVSDGVAEDLRDNLKLACARIERIYNAFDADLIRSLAQVSEPEVPRDPYLIHVGRFVPQKRHDLLFEAFKRSGLPHRLVLLAAPSPALSALLTRHALAERVLVAGFRPNPYPWMASAELLVLCSDHEGLPNVLVEALFCGTRVVSTDCPSGAREVLRGELTKYLVPCGDADALSRAMRASLDAPRPSVASLLEPFAAHTVLAQYEALAGS
jgi:glycosyltransferase involved in cell wall biosynthesis